MKRSMVPTLKEVIVSVSLVLFLLTCKMTTDSFGSQLKMMANQKERL